MNIIKEQRENVILENNKAQNEMISILEDVNKRTNTIDIREPLHGDLDFSILKELGFTNIKIISLEEGEITNITNIPEGVHTLKCKRNLLFSLENLPSSLTHLEIPNNYLSTIDFTNLKQLKYVNVSHNLFTEFENLPSEITELYCENNDLKYLDLKGLDNLNVLHISNNKITIIENLPENITDFQMENNPSIEFRNATVLPPMNKDDRPEQSAKQAVNYIEGIHEYFRIKHEYEAKLKELKKKTFKNFENKKIGMKKAKEVKAKCIQCKRPVGTIFSKTNNKYIAICGDTTKPCNLNIEIFNGDSSSCEDLLYVFKEHIDELKDKIIERKLATLFSYTTEEKSLELFKKELETYNEDSGMFKILLDHHNENFHNEHKKELIQKKNDFIFKLTERVRGLLDEYKKTNNREFLKSAVELQVKDLLPEIRNLRLLSSELMEMIPIEKMNKPTKYTLFKKDVVLSKMDFDFGEPARVMNFQKN